MAVNVDRTLRLPDAEYFPEPQAKSGIAIHHTVCDRARTTLALWERDHTPGGGRKRVATAFVIERDGTIYQAFDPACWAWQFGLSWRDDQRIPFEKRFIGIEITSEGGLLEQDGRLYAYEQLDAVGRLVDDLCTRFAIPRVYPEQLYVYYGDALASFQGVIGHAMVRSDKSDPAPDPRLWQTLRDVAGVKPVPVSPSALATAVATPLTPLQVGGLFLDNTRRLDRMHVAAGSLVKTLLMELERRDVYLELDTPAPGSHTIRYSVAEGDSGEVARPAQALGFKTVTDQLLVVRRA